MSVNHCSSESCCPHPDESQRVLKRDGVLVVACIECRGEVGPALELLRAPSETLTVTDVPNLGTPPVIPRVVTAAIGNINGIESCQPTQKTSTPVAVLAPAAPCGEDIAHRWGEPL